MILLRNIHTLILSMASIDFHKSTYLINRKKLLKPFVSVASKYLDENSRN